MNVLVTGGVRSGKSHHAETLLAEAPSVTYLATGPNEAEEPDPDWHLRLATHRARRPARWRTVESTDLAAVLQQAPDAVLVDCLGTWLTRVIDENRMWETPAEEVTDLIHRRTDDLVSALHRTPSTILVTNEVGLGVVPAHRSGRLFRDLLGDINRMVATACDEVHLVIAGRVLVL